MYMYMYMHMYMYAALQERYKLSTCSFTEHAQVRVYGVVMKSTRQ